ncbi:MAG: ABC transporter substrate-binding protein [Algicola sp.]|nr:ABC transporter substrate-binding protein [Algicola sp.]
MTVLFSFVVLLFIASAAVQAKASDPYQLIEKVANNTFNRIAADREHIARDANHLKIIVAEELMPYIDHRYASRIILYKTKVTKAQKKAFYKAFRQYLITTYATIFAKYSDQQVVFSPGKPFADRKKVVVKTKLVSDGIPDINIDFKVRKIKKSGQWKAYDLRAMGVSLLDSKKAELARLLRKEGGVDTVTALLNEKAQSNIVIAAQVGRL